MSTITAILPDQTSVEVVTDRLAALHYDTLDWRLVDPEEDQERILPAVGGPLGAPSNSTGSGVAAIPIQYDYPEKEALHDEGLPREEAAAVGRSIERGGTAIIIEVPADHENEVRRILEKSDAQLIVVE